MLKMTEKEWEERAERIRKLEAQRRAAGWMKDQWGRWIPPHNVIC